MKYYKCAKCGTIHNSTIQSISGNAEHCPACNYTTSPLLNGFFSKNVGTFGTFEGLRKEKIKKGIWVA